MTVTITPEQLRRLAPKMHLVYTKAFATANETLAPFGILDNPQRLAHFMVQIYHETGGFTILRESLNYSVEGLLATFGSKRIPRALAEKIGRTPERKADQIAIAEAAYGGEWGKKNLGNITPGDGWRYRGHSLPQLTGRANFRHFGEILGIDLEGNPDLSLDPKYALLLAATFWREKGCAKFADADDLRSVRRLWNGGAIGLEECLTLLPKMKREWPW